MSSKSDGFKNRASELQDFIDITSDKIIREAAYPEAEWIENGGGKGNGLFTNFLHNYSSVDFQDNPPTITKMLGLLGEVGTEQVFQNTEKRKANIVAHWQCVKAHPCYKKFHGYANDRLKLAVQTFEKKSKLNNAPEKLKSDLAVFRFYHVFAQSIAAFMLFSEHGYQPKYADAKMQRKAKGHVENLLFDFSEGVRLSYNHHQLESLLKQLLVEINQAPRKDKETPTAAKRRALECFAYFSMFEFGSASATILGYFAEILGWDNRSNSTMDNIVKKASEKYNKEQRERLIKRLQSPAIITKN